MGRAKLSGCDPKHKVWLVTIKNEDGKKHDVIVSISGDGKIAHSVVKKMFGNNIVAVVPMMHPVRIVKKGPKNEITYRGYPAFVNRCCKGWMATVNAGRERKEYQVLVVASGNNVIRAEDVARGVFDMSIHPLRPFEDQIIIDKSIYLKEFANG